MMMKQEDKSAFFPFEFLVPQQILLELAVFLNLDTPQRLYAVLALRKRMFFLLPHLTLLPDFPLPPISTARTLPRNQVIVLA